MQGVATKNGPPGPLLQGNSEPSDAPVNGQVRVALIAQSEEAVRHVTALLRGTKDVELAASLEQKDLVARLVQTAPSAVLLDASVSQGRALETLRLLRKSKETLSWPILVLCQKVIPEFRTTISDLGASDCLTYENQATEILARLRYHIKRTKERGTVRQSASELAMPAQHVVKILMIDESRVACHVVSTLFAKHPDMQVTTCTDPGKALRIADELLPTVVLQSLVMRDRDAFELVQALRRNLSTKEVPIIVLSGVADPVQKARALAVGADDYVVKSKDMEELLSRVRFHSAGYFDLLKGRLATSTSGAEEAETARVLLVDDSKFFCAAIAQVLASEPQIFFAACTDPTLAIETAREFRPTVILQDLEMPQMDGIELLQKLRENLNTRDVPIIVLSGITAAATKAKAFAEGANDYVEKQMDKVELISRIRYHSRGYRNARRLGDSIQKLFEIQKRLEIQGEFIRKTFGRYLSDEVVTSLLESPQGLKLGGEKRRITILMSDLRGFTSLSEQLMPEEVLSIINNYLKVMSEILLSYGATIDEFIGDSILAVFGAPKAQEDDAQRAVACAVEMQLAMQGVNEANRREGYPEVRMGIGIHTGDVIVGNIGSEMRAKYGVVGKNVNLTSRIESYTLGGQILVSEATQQACGPILRIDGLMEVMPKGVRQPIQIFDIGGIAGRFQRFLPEKVSSVLPTLAAPLAVRFRVLEDKHAAAEEYSAEIVSLGNGAGGLVAPGVELRLLDNVKITLYAAGGAEVTTELYGKVTECKELESKIFRVDFTSVPIEAAAFLDAVRKRGE